MAAPGQGIAQDGVDALQASTARRFVIPWARTEAGKVLGHEIRQRLKAVAWPTVFLGLVAYFAWHAMEGDRGIVAMQQRERLLAEARAELARVDTERETWERRVAALRGPLLDADMLDERARALLNLGDPRDIVVPYGPGNRLY